jgi:hypothetical protein
MQRNPAAKQYGTAKVPVLGDVSGDTPLTLAC